METITTSELDEDILLVLDQIIEDAEAGLDPTKAPYLMFTPDAAARLAKALRCLIQEEWWETHKWDDGYAVDEELDEDIDLWDFDDPDNAALWN